MNTTYQATDASPAEITEWLERNSWAAERVAKAQAADERLCFVDGELLTDEQVQEQYLSCEDCDGLVSAEPLTWGVTQYRIVDDCTVLCNGCYAKRLAQQLSEPLGIDERWPRYGAADLDQETFRHALEERASEDALLDAGYERTYETGVEGVGYGLTPSQARARCQEIMGRDPAHLFVLTVVQHQFCADITLWVKGA